MIENKQIKLLLVLPFFYPHRGGSQKYAEEIYAIMMKKHNNVHVDVLCYNTDKKEEYEEYRGYRIYRVPCWNVIPARFALANPFLLVKMLATLSKNKYDYVNTHIRFFDPTWWLWIYARIIGAKSIFTGHVATHPVHQNKFVEIVGKIVDLTIASVSINQYDMVTFTNKTAQKFFQQKLHLKIPSHIVYGGVDTNFFKPGSKINRIIPKVRTLISDDTVLISFTGRLIWTKGVTYLYSVAKKILSEKIGENAIFVLAGPGELEKWLEESIKNDGMEGKIIMTKDLTYDQVRQLLEISDIFVNPSHHNEGFPNTVLEGGAAQCYVIATDNAGTWEVVNEHTGELIPQKDEERLYKAIKWALENKKERDIKAKTMRNMLVEHFDWQVISETLYRILLNQKPKF